MARSRTFNHDIVRGEDHEQRYGFEETSEEKAAENRQRKAYGQKRQARCENPARQPRRQRLKHQPEASIALAISHARRSRRPAMGSRRPGYPRGAVPAPGRTWALADQPAGR